MNQRQRTPPGVGILAIVFLGLSGWCAWAYFAGTDDLSRTILVCRISGYTTLGFLAVAILIGPFARAATWMRIAIPISTSSQISRNSGIFSGVAALIHASVVLNTYLNGYLGAVFQWPYLQSGALAFGILMVLLIGSSTRLMMYLRWQLWKPLFRLSWVAAALIFHHLLSVPFSSPRLTIVLFGMGALVWFCRFVPARKTSGGN